MSITGQLVASACVSSYPQPPASSQLPPIGVTGTIHGAIILSPDTHPAGQKVLCGH